ncbi:MAG: hypothetical protein WAW92_00195 [Minisyncoccia bacterium]
MSKKIKSIVLMSILALPLTFVSAQTDSDDTKRRPVLNSIREEVREKIASTSDRMRDKIDQVRENYLRIAKIRLQNVISRFDATILRQENIYQRIVSRIEKIKSAGGNTARAESYIATAKTHIDTAKVALTSLKNASSTTVQNIVDSNTSTSTNAKNALRKIKDLALTIEKNLREAHAALTNAVKSLKGMSTTATTTPESN